MKAYTAYYKKTNAWFWTKIPHVKGDGCMFNEVGAPYRWFIRENEERLEIPMLDVMFKYSTERFICIKEQMELQIGQKIPTTAG
jgi:hypothetical protein